MNDLSILHLSDLHITSGGRKYSKLLAKRKGQNIGTLNKRAQGSMLLSSNYRRNSTYGPNSGWGGENN